MAFHGMDPEEVARAATLLRVQGELLARTVTEVDGIVEQAAAVWPGTDSDGFRDAWHAGHRAAIHRAATDTVARALWLLEQVADQIDVSSTGDGSALGTAHRWADGGVRVGPFDDLSRLNDLAGLVLGPLGLLSVLGANRNLTGRYGGLYGRFLGLVKQGRLGNVRPESFHYKHILNHGIFRPNGPLSRLEHSKLLGRLGLAGGVIQVGKGVDDFRNARDLNSRITIGGEIVADSLKMAKHPVPYLAGVAMSSARVIGEQAAVADFSPSGVTMVFDEIARDPVGSARTVGESIWKGFGDIL